MILRRGWIYKVSRWRVGRCLLRYGAVGALLPVLSCLYGFRQSKTNSFAVSIRENGYFRADRGYFFVGDGRLDVYDGGLDSGVIWDNALGQYALLRDTEKELARGDAPYYHETYQLGHGEWIRRDRNFTQKPKRYLDFGPCDAADQIDLPDDPLAGLDAGMRRVLPQGAKIKGVANFEGHFVIVVASRVPREAPSINEPGTYPLRLFLLVPTKNSWQILANVEAEKWANYCGMRTLDTTLKGGEPATLLLLYSSLPQGSRIVSVARQIRSYLIRPDGEGSRPK